MKTQPLNRLAYFILCACATLGGIPTRVQAASETWSATAANGAWETGANWVSGNAPGANSGTASPDVATFKTGSTALTILPDLGRNIFGITFDTSAVGAYVIGATGGNALLLSDGGTIQNTTAVNTNQTFLAPLAFQGSYTFTANSTASSNGKILIFSNMVGTASSGATNTLTLNGVNTGSNLIKGEIGDGAEGGCLSVVKSSAGKWALAGSNTFSGNITLNAGTLSLNNNSALGKGIFTINAGTLSTDAARTLTNVTAYVWNGNFSTSYSMPTLNLGIAPVTLASNTTVTLPRGQWDSNVLTIGGVISDGGNGRSLTVNTAGGYAGTLTLNGSNTFSGGITLNNGTLIMNSKYALGTGPMQFNGGGLSAPDGMVITNTNILYLSNISLPDGIRAFDFGQGPMILTTNATINIARNNLTIRRPIADDGKKFRLTLNSTDSYQSESLNLNGTNTFGGGVDIVPLGGNGYNSKLLTLNIGFLGTDGTASALGTGTFRILQSTFTDKQLIPAIDNTSGSAGNLATSNPQVWSNSFTFVGTTNLNMGTGAITMATNVTITVNKSTFTLGGVIDDGAFARKLTKAGLGTLVLSSTNNYDGGTIVTNGTLTVEATATLGSGNVFIGTNATLRLLTSTAISNTATVQLVTVGSAYGKAYLTNDVIEVVSGVMIGGNLYSSPGTYGSTASGATYPFDTHFLGEGKLRIVAPTGTLIQFL
jgi:autotransporter-associated beta strand protein